MGSRILFSLLLAFSPRARAQSFKPVVYTVEEGPGARIPEIPPNLRPSQLREFIETLSPYSSDLQPKYADKLFYRVIAVLTELDKRFMREIPPEEWSRRLGEASALFAQTHGDPSQAKMDYRQFEAAIDQMLEKFVSDLKDPFTSYLNETQNRGFLEAHLLSPAGIGVTVQEYPEGLKIVEFMPGSPAALSGLLLGDVIHAIDGQEIAGLSPEELARLLSGGVGTNVELGVIGRAGSVVLKRTNVAQSVLFGRMLSAEIGYIFLSRFPAEIDQVLFRKLDELRAAGATKLILDLRFNPGGVMLEAISIASEFLGDRNMITQSTQRGQISQRAAASAAGRYLGMPLVILVNGESASASEVLAGALQGHKRAVILGSKTYGKYSFQAHVHTAVPGALSGLFYEDGTGLKVTQGEWSALGGGGVQGQTDPLSGLPIAGSGGLTPDVELIVGHEQQGKVVQWLVSQLRGRDEGAVSDPLREKAVELLSQLELAR